jgi:plasmid stabilization system protein ParE
MKNSKTYSSLLSSKAQKEVLVSWKWYEERSKGLGDRFVKEVTETILEIEQDPDRYSSKYKNYRQTRIATFPFLIIFKINERNKIVRIVSVFHTSRNPNKKY